MKNKIVFLLLFVISIIPSNYLYSQDNSVFTIKGVRVTIKESNSLFVKGNVKVLSIENDKGVFHNEGLLIISDTLFGLADSLFVTSTVPGLSNETTDSNQDPMGTVVFIGNGQKTITGNEPFYFYNLKNEYGRLNLDSNIKVFGEIEFNQGDIYLNNNNIELFDLSNEVNIYDGKIKNGSETNDFKIFDDGDGYIKAYKLYDENSDPANLGFEISTNNQIGDLFVTRYHISDIGVTDGSLKKKIILEEADATSFGASIDIKFKFFDSDLTDELQYNDSSLRLFYKPLGGNINKYVGGVYDTVFNFVQAQNVNFRLGHYTIADTICDHPPQIDLGNDRIICQDSKIDLIADTLYSEQQQSLMTYKWYTEDPLFEESVSPQITIIKDTINKYIGDTITISLLVADERGCINMDTVHYFIAPKPTIGIKILKPSSNICIGDTINLIDTIPGNSTGVYEWDFISEGYASNNQTETFVYELTEGGKKIEVSFTDTNGCVTDTLIDVTINPLPEPSFLVNQDNCLGDALFIENQSYVKTSPVSSSILNYEWDLGNGNTIEVNQVSVSSDSTLLFESDIIRSTNGIPGPSLTYWYKDIGQYNIKLTAITDAGCVYDTTVTTFIRDSVFASFDVSDYTNACSGEESKFFPDEATSDTNLVAHYEWHINDTIILANALDDTISFIFNDAGNYDVSLVAVSKFGCSNSVTKTIEIFDTPNVQFTVDPVCFNNKSKFNSSGSSESELNYRWSFSDTTISASSSESLEYTFENSGNYLVTLEIELDNGCRSSFTDTAVVLENPEAKYSFKDVCVNNQLNDTLIENLSINANDVNYTWDFGDGTKSPLKQPIKNYKNAGSYSVRLDAIQTYYIDNEEFNCFSHSTDQIEIYDVAPANFMVGDNTNVCEGSVSVFILSDMTNADLVNYYEWNLLSDTLLPKGTAQFEYTFDHEGQYNVTLKTLTVNGCADSITKPVEIYNIPDIELVADSICLGDELVFSINEYNSDANNEYKWFFDGDYIGGSLYTSITPLVANKYEVVLEALSEHGCIQTEKDTAVVYSLPEDEFGDQIAVCSDTFCLMGEKENTTYLWNNEIIGKEYTATNSGEVEVKITNNQTGCVSFETIDIKLNSPLKVDLGNDTSVCDNIVLDAGYFGNAAAYLWSDKSTGRYLRVESSGEYSVRVEHGGCYDEDTIFVQINENPELDLGQDIEICAFETVLLDATIPNGTYEWSDGTFSNILELKPINAQEVNYKVTVTDENGCKAKDQIKVTSRPIPSIDLGDDITTCQNEEVFINATTANVTLYVWNTGETTSVLYPEVNNNNLTEESYSVTVENRYGCKDSDTISVIFYPVSEVILQDEIVACGNEEVELTAYNHDIISYNWNNGSTDSTLIINAATDGNGIYYVSVENIYGCFTTSNQASVSFNTIPTSYLPEEITGCIELELDAGNFGASFLWNDHITTQKRKVYQSGQYSVRITNGDDCSIIDTVDVTVNYVTKPYLGPDLELCVNDTKVLRTGLHDPEYSFEWNGYSTSDTMMVATGGVYIVKATHSNGCSDADTIILTERPLPDVQLGPDMYWCTHDHIILDAGTDGFAYEWGSSKKEEGYGRLYEVADTGTYWVQVTNDYNCFASDTIHIYPTSLSIDPMFITNSKLIAGDSVLFVDMSVPQPTGWLWEFGDLQQSVLQNPVHVYYGKGEYQVNLHVSNSVCTASIIKIIEVKQRNKTETEELDENLKDNNFIEIQSVKIFPNPTSGNISIEAELSTRTNANLYMFDLMGRLIELRKYSNVDVLYEYLDIQNENPGIYIIKIIAGTDHKTYKIIKQ